MPFCLVKKAAERLKKAIIEGKFNPDILAKKSSEEVRVVYVAHPASGLARSNFPMVCHVQGDRILRTLPIQQVQDHSGHVVSYRRLGQGPVLGLLHGIGAASGTWLPAMQMVGKQFDVLAWDAPGYGLTTALKPETPKATDYAQRMWHWLDALPVAVEWRVKSGPVRRNRRFVEIVAEFAQPLPPPAPGPLSTGNA